MSFLLVNKEHRVLRITLNRPEKRNALTLEMCRGLVDAIEAAQDDVSIGSILLEGAGRAFSAGMDLDEAVADTGDESAAVHERLFSLGRNAKKPIVAYIGGPALGGGLGLAVQAHVAVAAQGALFGLTEIRTGLWPFLVYRSIEEAVGPRRALELSLTGRLFSTQEALTWGVVHQVAHAFEAEDRAEGMARELAKASPLATGLGFEYVRQGRGRSWNEAGEVGARLRRISVTSNDFKEGVAAFHEQREARWPSMPPGTYSEASPPDAPTAPRRPES